VTAVAAVEIEVGDGQGAPRDSSMIISSTDRENDQGWIGRDLDWRAREVSA
jgi:hypothetical protein